MEGWVGGWVGENTTPQSFPPSRTFGVDWSGWVGGWVGWDAYQVAGDGVGGQAVGAWDGGEGLASG